MPNRNFVHSLFSLSTAYKNSKFGIVVQALLLAVGKPFIDGEVQPRFQFLDIPLDIEIVNCFGVLLEAADDILLDVVVQPIVGFRVALDAVHGGVLKQEHLGSVVGDINDKVARDSGGGVRDLACEVQRKLELGLPAVARCEQEAGQREHTDCKNLFHNC